MIAFFCVTEHLFDMFKVGQKFDLIRTGFDFHLTSFWPFSVFSTKSQTCSNGPNICLTNVSNKKSGKSQTHLNRLFKRELSHKQTCEIWPGWDTQILTGLQRCLSYTGVCFERIVCITGVDPYQFPPFYESQSDFSQQIYFLLTVNFPDETLKMVWTFSANLQALSEENGTSQYSAWRTQKPRKGDFRELNSKKNFPGEQAPGPPWKLAHFALIDSEIGHHLSQIHAWYNNPSQNRVTYNPIVVFIGQGCDVKPGTFNWLITPLLQPQSMQNALKRENKQEQLIPGTFLCQICHVLL